MLKKISLFLVLLGVLWVSGCSTTGPTGERAFHTRIYIGTYDQVWLASLKALADYPLKISNKDVGKIESEVINGPYNDLLFEHPDPISLPERFRYSLRLNFAKLVSDDNRSLVRIRVIKSLEKFQDFYRGWKEAPPDGLEEKVILYRVEQILRVDKLLKKQGYN